MLPDFLQGNFQKIIERVCQALLRIARQGFRMPSIVQFLNGSKKNLIPSSCISDDIGILHAILSRSIQVVGDYL